MIFIERIEGFDMKTVVTGGAGFIGSNLCETLLKCRNQVICIDNLSLGSMENINNLLEYNNFKFCRGDVTELDFLEKIFSDEMPEVVFHLAANSNIQASAENPEIEYKNTYTTTYIILECMRRNGIKKIFFASTSAVYGDQRDIKLSENTPGLSPISYYGAAKLGSEALIHAYTYMNDMKAIIFRFPNVIGPRLTHGVIYDFIRKLDENNESLTILGDGHQTKPYIYVQDLIKAIIDFMKSVKDGVQIYNLGVTGSTSVKTIADIVCEEMGLTNVTYVFTGGEAGWKGDVPRFQYCFDKISKQGWKAEYTSDEAVRKTVREIVKEQKMNVR